MTDHAKIIQKIREADQKLRWEEYFRLFVKMGHISPLNIHQSIQVVNTTIDEIDKNFANRADRAKEELI